MNDKIRDKLIMFNTTVNLLLVVLLLSAGGLVWAGSESNGVWHRAEDVRGGVFGDDEVNQSYEFRDKVDMTGVLCIDGECYDSWGAVCDNWVQNSTIN